jgi:hypothetical protein
MFTCLYFYCSLSNASNFAMFCNCGHKHQTCFITCYYYKVWEKDSSNVHMKFVHKKCWVFKRSSFGGCNSKLCEISQHGLLVPNAFFNKRYISKIRCRLFFLLSNDRIGTFTLNKLIISKSVEVKFRFKLEYQVYSKVHHFDVWNTKNLD